MIDHINHDTSDNSIENLRWVSNRTNQQNQVNNSIYGHNIDKNGMRRKAAEILQFYFERVETHGHCFKAIDEALLHHRILHEINQRNMEHA